MRQLIIQVLNTIPDEPKWVITLARLTMENNKNNETQNRREFFKEAARKALPIIGAVALMSNPVLTRAAQLEPTYCEKGCYATCADNCTGSCRGDCRQSCRTSCSEGCQGSSYSLGNSDCGNSCRSVCWGCQGGCKGSCSGSCSGGAKRG